MKKKIKTIRKFVRLAYEDYIARLIHKDCRVRETDILIGSYPKSGRTWVRFFLSAYINAYYDLGIYTDWDNFHLLTPGPLCKRTDGLLSVSRNLEYRVIFSHESRIGRYFPGRKTVFITRNFLDILVSYYYFHKNRNKTYYMDLTIDDFVLKEFKLQNAIDRINYFSVQIKKASHYLILPYEVMRKDPEKKFKELIDFSYYRFDEKIFASALERSSFSSMRKMEKRRHQHEKSEKFHTRSGEIYKFKSYLKPETISFVEQQLEKNLFPPLRNYYVYNQLASML